MSNLPKLARTTRSNSIQTKVYNLVSYLNRHGSSHAPATPRVVEPTYERPEELDDPREQLAEVSKNYQEQRYTNYRVYYSRYLARSGFRSYVTVT